MKTLINLNLSGLLALTVLIQLVNLGSPKPVTARVRIGPVTEQIVPADIKRRSPAPPRLRLEPWLLIS